MRDYKELVVWQKSMLLVEEVYKLMRFMPKEEMYGLANQIRRAAVSIPSNIAEGYGRNTDKELASFLHISRGSASELETQLILCVRLGMLDREQVAEPMALLTEIKKMLNGLIRKTKDSR